jgi:bifunctional DNA-binding transcriptional regulator/antitoxin component of YhaV-PrlF toxin-antitoxin module
MVFNEMFNQYIIQYRISFIQIPHISIIMITDDRKITGDKFVITLPQTWRELYGLKPGQYITTLYREGEAGPMVIIPKDVELGELQRGLVLALLDVPSTLQTQELSQQLKQLAAQLDQIE